MHEPKWEEMVAELTVSKYSSSHWKSLNYFQKKLYIYSKLSLIDSFLFYNGKPFLIIDQFWVIGRNEQQELGILLWTGNKKIDRNEKAKFLQLICDLCKSVISFQSELSLWCPSKMKSFILSNDFRAKDTGVFKTLSSI